MKPMALQIFCVAVLGCVCLAASSPVKVSRPQAVTAANLTDEQAQALLQENPPRPSILRPSDQFLPPSFPIYLPDPERNKSNDDIHLLSTYAQDAQDAQDAQPDGSPVKLSLALDSFVRPPPLPSLDPIGQQVYQAEKDKSSYSYNNRFDYYFPVRTVYEEGHKYADKELQMMELQPPAQSDEPDYYAVKPKKVPKKYQPNKKEVSRSKSFGDDERLVPIDNDGLVLNAEQSSFVTSSPVERFAPAPSLRDLSAEDLNTGEYIPKSKQEQITESLSPPESTASIVAAGSQKVAQFRQSARSVNFGLSSAKLTAA